MLVKSLTGQVGKPDCGEERLKAAPGIERFPLIPGLAPGIHDAAPSRRERGMEASPGIERSFPVMPGLAPGIHDAAPSRREREMEASPGIEPG